MDRIEFKVRTDIVMSCGLRPAIVYNILHEDLYNTRAPDVKVVLKNGVRWSYRKLDAFVYKYPWLFSNRSGIGKYIDSLVRNGYVRSEKNIDRLDKRARWTTILDEKGKVLK